MWDVRILIILAFFIHDGFTYIESVVARGCESCLLLLTCRHVDSIIAVVDASFEPLDDTLIQNRSLIFPPAHPRFAINRRCSGANHCSFILNKDCPGADKWGAGNITVKYVCISGYQVNKYCNQEISLPFREGNSSRSEGLIHNPGYPHFYLSHEPYCKWKIKALPFQKIKLTILDLAVIIPPKEEDPCRDKLQVMESGSILYSSCTQKEPPMEITSSRNVLEVSFQANESFVPRRGVLAFYTAVGCPTPQIPEEGLLVYRNDSHAEIACYVDHYFLGSEERTKILTCHGYQWDRKLPLPDCVRGFREVVKKESNSNMDEGSVTADIIIPVILIAALFVINGIVIFIIHKQRKKKAEETGEELNTLRG